jgi:hypothetical protein
MAYGTRPYGIWAYGFGPYSTWRMVSLGGVVLDGVSATTALLSVSITHLIVAALGGRSGIAATAYSDLQAHVGPLTGQSGIAPNLRLFWELEIPCDAPWAPGVPCEVIWSPVAGCDAAWVVQPPPPLLCPDALEVVDG